MTSRTRLALLALIVLAPPATLPAAASAGGSTEYTNCAAVAGTVLVAVARTRCEDVQAVASAVGAASTPDDEVAALVTSGWTPMRALPAEDLSTHDLIAVRGRAALRVSRGGPAPDLDGWSAGRELVFARPSIVGGRPIPRGAAACTSAFLVRRRGGTLGGLSAAHCGGLRSDGRVQRRNVALRRPPQPGIVLGRVLQILTRRLPIDALLLPVRRAGHETATAVVDRGIGRPPLPVVGTARPLSGRRVCFTGRTSGPDRCGRILGAAARPLENLFALQGLLLRCTTITARRGDSGGPVYTAPGADGAVRAVGIITLITGPRSFMCFTPITLALRGLDARIVTV